MKRIIFPLLVLVLISSVVLAGCPCNDNSESNPATGKVASVIEYNASKGERGIQPTSTPMIHQRIQPIAKNVTELRQMVQERQELMNQELKNLTVNAKQIYQNQNRVRLAVHSLLAMENLTGGIGRNVSRIAREFNNSVQATIRAEQRIETRNMLVKFLFGGDEVAAGEMEQEIIQNQQRIQHLRQLMNQCDCEEQVRAMLQEQIQNMEQEHTRLQQLAQNEKGNKGLFGWLWK